jgi:hypothetical protein
MTCHCLYDLFSTSTWMKKQQFGMDSAAGPLALFDNSPVASFAPLR